MTLNRFVDLCLMIFGVCFLIMLSIEASGDAVLLATAIILSGRVWKF